MRQKSLLGDFGQRCLSSLRKPHRDKFLRKVNAVDHKTTRYKGHRSGLFTQLPFASGDQVDLFALGRNGQVVEGLLGALGPQVLLACMLVVGRNSVELK